VTGRNETGVKPQVEAPDLFTGEAPIESALKTWTAVQKDLAYALGPNVHRSWTERLRVSFADPYAVTLTAPTRFIASKVESSYSEALRRLWKKHDQVAPPRDVIVTHPQSHAQTQASKQALISKQAALTPPVKASSAKRSPTYIPEIVNTSAAQSSSPRQRFQFDNFIVGPSNEFAFAAARQIANSEEAQYNPVVIHGTNGMGKTHLLYAILQDVETRTPARRARIISGEEFVSTFVKSVRGNGRDAIETFKAGLRGVDLLMIDDVQFIVNKPGSQEELLHTLVSLVDDGRQVLVAMDRHPNDVDAASERLKSYLSSGLVCKIGPADYELRIRMLDRLIARRRQNGNPTLTIPKNVRDHMAARISATPRDLEGAFNQVVAQSEFLGTPITLEAVQSALSDSRYTAARRLTVDRIQRAVAEEFKISLDDMVSKRRARVVARPRQIAMYLSKTMTKRSLPDIGRRFGGRDHTTVMHAVKRVSELCNDDPEFKARVKGLEAELQG